MAAEGVRVATPRARSVVGGTLLIVGVLMGAQWLFFLATGSVEELETAPRAIAFHLAAEAVTAVLLVVAGVGLLRGVGERLGLIATGALLYTVINSAGYFAERSEWPMVAMFGVLLVVAVGCAALLALPRSAAGPPPAKARIGLSR
jgi:ABC-type glucose/galactose transport system permease subunit